MPTPSPPCSWWPRWSGRRRAHHRCTGRPGPARGRVGRLRRLVHPGRPGLRRRRPARGAGHREHPRRVRHRRGGARAAFVLRAIGDIGDGTLSWLSPDRRGPEGPTVRRRAVVAPAAAGRGDGAARRSRPRSWPPGATSAQGSWRRGRARPRRRRASGIPWVWPCDCSGLGPRLGRRRRWSSASPTAGSGPPSTPSSARTRPSPTCWPAAGGGSLTDLYFATSFRVMALIATGFAIQSALRVRGEETSMRAELVLATPVSRWRFAGSHLAVACVGSVVLLAVAGLATGLSYGIAGGDMQSVPRLLEAAARLRAGDVAHGRRRRDARRAGAPPGSACRGRSSWPASSWACSAWSSASPTGSSSCRRSSACRNCPLRA